MWPYLTLKHSMGCDDDGCDTGGTVMDGRDVIVMGSLRVVM